MWGVVDGVDAEVRGIVDITVDVPASKIEDSVVGVVGLKDPSTEVKLKVDISGEEYKVVGIVGAVVGVV